MVVFLGFGTAERYQRLRVRSREIESHSFMFHYLSIVVAAADLLRSFLRAPQKTPRMGCVASGSGTRMKIRSKQPLENITGLPEPVTVPQTGRLPY